jgi:hypothetical protein
LNEFETPRKKTQSMKRTDDPAAKGRQPYDPAQGFGYSGKQPLGPMRSVPEPDGRKIIRGAMAEVAKEDNKHLRQRPAEKVTQDWRKG